MNAASIRRGAAVRIGGQWVPLYAPEPRTAPHPAPYRIPKVDPPNVARFLPEPGASVFARELWAAYVRACDTERVSLRRRLTRGAFYRALDSLGAVRTATREGLRISHD